MSVVTLQGVWGREGFCLLSVGPGGGGRWANNYFLFECIYCMDYEVWVHLSTASELTSPQILLFNLLLLFFKMLPILSVEDEIRREEMR